MKKWNFSIVEWQSKNIVIVEFELLYYTDAQCFNFLQVDLWINIKKKWYVHNNIIYADNRKINNNDNNDDKNHDYNSIDNNNNYNNSNNNNNKRIVIKNLQFGSSLLLSSRSVETTRTTVDNRTKKNDTNATIRDLKYTNATI